ncbi:MAG: sulfite exporter TauE/SafE family protein [Acidimicrobiales bacterium]|nr:sulfite exporter TauE/SafE family protein [Acidimicrobiales bacterium]
MSLQDLLLASIVIMAGSGIQGAVGFGGALFAAPFLMLIDPHLVPGPVNIAGIVLSALMMQRDSGGHHWDAVRWPMIGLLPGSIAGAAVLRALSESVESLTMLFANTVLAAVVLSIIGFHPRRKPGQLFIGGTASGFMGTAAGIGGPPIALFFQTATGPEIRGALARFFAISSAISLALLWLFGQLGHQELVAGLWLVPATVAGFVASRWLATRIDRGHVRVAVLTLSGLSSLVAIGRAVLT